jgi:hypothetical protein
VLLGESPPPASSVAASASSSATSSSNGLYEAAGIALAILAIQAGKYAWNRYTGAGKNADEEKEKKSRERIELLLRWWVRKCRHACSAMKIMPSDEFQISLMRCISCCVVMRFIVCNFNRTRKEDSTDGFMSLLCDSLMIDPYPCQALLPPPHTSLLTQQLHPCISLVLRALRSTSC